MYRDHNCGELTIQNVGETVTIAGWVQKIRNLGSMVFIDLRDQFGITQIVVAADNKEQLTDVVSECVIQVVGKVIERSNKNTKISTGEIEVEAEKIEILGKCKTVLPFEVNSDKTGEVKEDLRLEYRFLDLRNDKLHKTILLRNEVMKTLRKKMDEMGFTEIQTPILANSSPEGARDYLVPSRLNPGEFYALPQAPQQFKQLLMVSGFDKYFQIAPCFRDEDARKDRIYGEFYQLDLEMSFVTEEDVYAVGEKIFYDVFTNFTKKIVNKPPFVRIPYKESMLKYGTDKPDLRNPLIINDLTNVFKTTTFKPFYNTPVRGIKVRNIADKSNSWFNEIVDYASSIGMPGIGYITYNGNLSFKGPIDKFLTDDERRKLISLLDLKENDVLFFIASHKDVNKLAGLIRIFLGNKLELIDNNRFEFCIVNDFPMFEYNEEEKKIDFTHNPFSMPKGGMDALNGEPVKVVANQFDFVCNGIELASGAVRNHDIEIMEKAFDIAGYTKEDLENRFAGLYTAFQYGCPPHAGMAPGIDRIIMMLLDEENIRETIAFPMNANGADLLMGAPTSVSEKQLRETHIKIREKE